MFCILLRLVTEDHDAQLFFQLRIFLCQQFARLNHVIYALAGIHNLHRTEQNQLTVLRKHTLLPCSLFIMRLVEVGVDGIRDIRNDVSAEKGTLFGTFFQPMTTGNEIDVASFV